MKLRFEPDLPHQREAIAAVAGRVDAEAVQPGGLQMANGVVAHANPVGLPARLAVEMETGTGKTYVFLRTALELAAHHGVRKFVIVVPSVAIREGVLATLQSTREHFGQLFPRLVVRSFAYRRERLTRLRQFVRGGDVEFMVVTIDAFTKDTNILRRPCDTFSGHAPLTALAATRPVVIVDEPHRMRSRLRSEALALLQPSSVLAYGATLGGWDAPVVHRLTPARAHAAGLVKSIVVHGGGRGYAAQIRDTVAAHLQRAAALRERGIKVLSLFFLDAVASYADDDGIARLAFDEAFDALKADSPGFAELPPSAVRSAYFATRGGRAIDSKTGRAAADADAYELILRDKPRLLSMDEPVSFVFSHSALREGWDNPNVFQVCTLGRSDSAVRKRQEIGRGIRLCVDQAGRRVVDPTVNVLEVFANESYEEFVAGLQSGEVRPMDERAPLASRGGPPRTRAEDVREMPLDDRTLVETAARELSSFEPVDAAPTAALVERVLIRLQRHGVPLRRQTVLAVLEASGRADALLADPVRGASAVVDALLRALQTTTPRGV
jgi:restriction endonuclease